MPRTPAPVVSLDDLLASARLIAVLHRRPKHSPCSRALPARGHRPVDTEAARW